MTSAPATLSLPTASPELAARLQEGLAAVDALMRSEIDHDDPFVAQASSPLNTVAITIGTVITLVLGILPAQVLDLAERSSQFLVR